MKQQPNKTLRGAVILLAVIAAAALLGTAAFFITSKLSKGKDDPATATPMNAVPANAAAQTDVSETETEESTDPAETPPVSAETLVAILMENVDVWGPDLSLYPYGINRCCFLDLDLDGIPELILSNSSGVGRISLNRYYQIDVDSRTVTKIGDSDDELRSDFDLYGLDEEYAPKLLKNRETDERYYYCADITRVSYHENGKEYGTMKYTGGEVTHDPLFFEHTTDLNTGKGETVTYTLYDNGVGTEVDSETYAQEKDAFFAQHEDLHLEFDTFSASEFNDADDETRTAMLLDACRAFRYDGFSIN